MVLHGCARLDTRTGGLDEELDTHHRNLDDTNSQRPVRARVYRPVPRV